jgi:hypothetical protein
LFNEESSDSFEKNTENDGSFNKLVNGQKGEMGEEERDESSDSFE